jgi:DNA polymerase-3 subunit epsilon
MREIILDTETTGLDPETGHRIVEVACLELLNHIPTGRHFQAYFNPERDMPREAEEVHGLTAAFLADKPKFAEVVERLLEFIGDAALVIHNAEFDLKFLNAELRRAELPPLGHRVVDTLMIARRKFPGAQASLDALCRRFAIDNSARSKHGALLDTELLAEVYLELVGGRQAGLDLAGFELAEAAAGIAVTVPGTAAVARPPRPHTPTPEEEAAHAALLAKLKQPIWLN